jgi:2-oxo-4-hydroxy-4-carboxy-5-ureidoimidazoline decarboxylase
VAADSAALDRFNAMPADKVELQLFSCCASRVWAHEVAVGRPYQSLDELVTAADTALARLSWPGVVEALTGHPRIGDLPIGASREAGWSRREQAAAAATADAEATTALAEANRAYELRFGHIFLIFASGRSTAEIAAAARERLGNDDETEQAVVRGELGKIVRLRLERLVAP